MGNTRCPDSKGIKTLDQLGYPFRREIPDALIQKGLRLGVAHDVGVDGNTRCPDSKGIKTFTALTKSALMEIPDALIQKGLRQVTSPDGVRRVKYQMP